MSHSIINQQEPSQSTISAGEKCSKPSRSTISFGEKRSKSFEFGSLRSKSSLFKSRTSQVTVLNLRRRQRAYFDCVAERVTNSDSTADGPREFRRLKDTGAIDDAFNHVDADEVFDEAGVKKYQEKCKELGIIPLSRVTENLTSQALDLKLFNLNDKHIEALATILKVNKCIETLILRDNWLTTKSAGLIGQVLEENGSISTLNMKGCHIGPEGAALLNEGIMSTNLLKSLDLSYNELGDEGLMALKPAFCENKSLKQLSLKCNLITEDSAAALKQILMENETVESLDLSWNFFCSDRGLKTLADGLAKNKHVTSLNLAWNGIRNSAPLTQRYLARRTAILEELDLSDNRLQESAMLTNLAAAVNRNKCLREVKVAANPYTPGQATDFLQVLSRKSRDHPLRLIDLQHHHVTKDYLAIRNRFVDKEQTVKIDGILGDFRIVGPDFRKLLFNRVKYLAMKPKKKKARRDFGQFLLSLPPNKVDDETFRNLLKKHKVKKLDDDLVKQLIAEFQYKVKKGSVGGVDVGGMQMAYLERFPDTVLPLKGAKKAKRRKGGRGKKKKKKKGSRTPTRSGSESSGTNLTVKRSKSSRPGSATAVSPKSSKTVSRQQSAIDVDPTIIAGLVEELVEKTMFQIYLNKQREKAEGKLKEQASTAAFSDKALVQAKKSVTYAMDGRIETPVSRKTRDEAPPAALAATVDPGMLSDLML